MPKTDASRLQDNSFLPAAAHHPASCDAQYLIYARTNNFSSALWQCELQGADILRCMSQSSGVEMLND